MMKFKVPVNEPYLYGNEKNIYKSVLQMVLFHQVVLLLKSLKKNLLKD